MTVNEGVSKRIAVDPEHGGIRLVVTLAFIAGGVIGYVVINALLPSTTINVIAFFGGLFLAWVASQLTERALKGRWASGRYVEMAADGVRLRKRDETEVEIDGNLTANVMLWRFEVKTRRSRITRGWFMLACALRQDEEYLPVYTFVSPEYLEQMPDSERFTPLVSKKKLEDAGERNSLSLVGEQRRLHTAEQHRWMDGAEMHAEDFFAYLEWLEDTFPRWLR